MKKYILLTKSQKLKKIVYKSWYARGMSLSDIGRKEEVSTTTIFRRFKKYKLQTDPVRRKSGVSCHLWRGGRCIRQGYVWIKMNEHPRRNYGGYIREHILVMENYLGRYLKKGEIVHHKDENKTNNHIDNLQLMTDSKHKSYHAKKQGGSDESIFDYSIGVSSLRHFVSPGRRGKEG